jgi:hypothetical protein
VNRAEWIPPQARSLGCPLLGCTYDHGARLVRLHLPAGCCTDMAGTLEFALTRFPATRRIETFAGVEPDTAYEKHGRAWFAYLPSRRYPSPTARSITT